MIEIDMRDSVSRMIAYKAAVSAGLYSDYCHYIDPLDCKKCDVVKECAGSHHHATAALLAKNKNVVMLHA